MFPGHRIRELPAHQQRRLADAFEARMLPDNPSPVALRSVLGISEDVDTVIKDLNELARIGICGPAVAAWVRAVEQASSRIPIPDLVWSGPEVPGLPARDTRQVYEEIFGSASRSVWVSTFVYFDGPRAFEELAKRMEKAEDLRVTLLLNIQRSRGDTTLPDQLVRRFTDQFWGRDWPGSSKPAVYYDPRSLETSGPSGVLHAKAVVVDEETVFITSANLTAAALDRNIELGVLMRYRTLARSVARHFQGLIDAQLLRPLPTI